MDDIVSGKIGKAKGAGAGVPAGEFSHNFGRYKLQAQHQAVPVSSHGSIIGYFVSAREYHELQRLKRMRREVFDTADLSEEDAKTLVSTRMDPRHAHLDELDDKL